jgi:hypothetical protein
MQGVLEKCTHIHVYTRYCPKASGLSLVSQEELWYGGGDSVYFFEQYGASFSHLAYFSVTVCL